MEPFEGTVIVLDFAYLFLLVLAVLFYEAFFALRKLVFNDQQFLLVLGLQFLELVVKTRDILLLFGHILNHLLVARSMVQRPLLVVSQLLLEPFSLLSGGLILLVRHLFDHFLIFSLLSFHVVFFLL